MNSFINNFKIIYTLIRFLPSRTSTYLILLVPLMLFCGVAEIISLAAVIPYLDLLINPSKIAQFLPFGDYLLRNLEFDEQKLKILITLIFILLAIFSATLRLVNQRLICFLTARIGTDLSTQAFDKVLNMDYQSYILSSNSRNTNLLMDDTSQSVSAINSSLNFLTNLITILFISIALFINNVSTTLMISSLFLFFYIIIVLITKNKLINNGEISVKARTKAFKVLNDSLGGFRDVILEKSHYFYITKFKTANHKYRTAQYLSKYLAVFPKLILEVLGISSIVIYALVVALKSEDVVEILSQLGLIAFAAAKILPMFQTLYGAYAQVQARKTSIEALIQVLSTSKKSFLDVNDNSPDLSKFNFSSVIFTNVSFKYPDSISSTLKNININIEAGETVGIMGASGSGKSTFVDLLMGLLKPLDGTVKYIYEKNMENISTDNPSQFQKDLSHVPQNIFLSDLTIEENIAFGKPFSKIDKKLIIEAANNSEIDDFIFSLPNGFRTRVGERGIMLSGGQRQRIGIARSLYKSAQIIILDEATSALDFKTESKLMKNVFEINKNNTVIVISHHQTTLSNCDKVLVFSEGQIANVLTGSNLKGENLKTRSSE